MILIYRILTNILYPVIILIIYLRKFYNKEHNNRYKEKIFSSKFNINKDKNSKLIWFHAASIGELKSILPILKEINKTGSNLEFLVTTITQSSANLAEKEFKSFDNIHHRFFPIDIKFLIKKFILNWKPVAIFLVDSEIWPNLIFIAKENKIPLALINARITSKSFNRWMLLPSFAKTIFNSFELCLASSLESKNFLKELNARNIFYHGNLKLISVEDNLNLSKVNLEFLKQNRFWLAVSTHHGEEELCLKTHLKLKEKFKNIITIIAPRHIQRSQNIKNLCSEYNLKSQILNNSENIQKNFDIIIVNSFGLLSSYFKYAKSVFVGKSTLKKLEKVGGQNPIEAAKFGCRIYHGPYVYNFREIYEILEKNRISKKINEEEELSKNLSIDLENFENKNNENSLLIKNLGKQTLSNTILDIKNFLKNDVQ